MYVTKTLADHGVVCPERYLLMLKQTPINRVIADLIPWAFLPDPERSSEYCTEVVGQSVLPFAQAIGEDLMACFLMKGELVPSVIVINPWSEDKSKIVQENLENFDDWVDYARKVSQEVMARDQDDAEED